MAAPSASVAVSEISVMVIVARRGLHHTGSVGAARSLSIVRSCSALFGGRLKGARP